MLDKRLAVHPRVPHRRQATVASDLAMNCPASGKL